MAQGWLPTSKFIPFKDVKSVDIVKIRNVFDPDSENTAIVLSPKQGRTRVIGTKLDNDQIIKVGLAMKGSVAISNTLQRILGDEGTVSDVVDTAKEIWKSFKSKEE